MIDQKHPVQNTCIYSYQTGNLYVYQQIHHSRYLLVFKSIKFTMKACVYNLSWIYISRDDIANLNA